MADEGTPIAYSGLSKGVAVVSSSGRQFATVEHVLEIPEKDLFDGIVVDTAQGLRFVDRDQIDDITTARVRCLLSDEEAAALPEPEGTETFEADLPGGPGPSLTDRLGRLFGRPHWRRTD